MSGLAAACAAGHEGPRRGSGVTVLGSCYYCFVAIVAIAVAIVAIATAGPSRPVPGSRFPVDRGLAIDGLRPLPLRRPKGIDRSFLMAAGECLPVRHVFFPHPSLPLAYTLLSSIVPFVSISVALETCFVSVHDDTLHCRLLHGGRPADDGSSLALDGARRPPASLRHVHEGVSVTATRLGARGYATQGTPPHHQSIL